jgi:hypothetical protein
MERKMGRVGIRVKWQGRGKEGNYKIYILYSCVAKQESKKKKMVSSDETKREEGNIIQDNEINCRKVRLNA